LFCFSRNSRYIIRLFIWDFSFIMWALITINFPLSSAFLYPNSSGKLFFSLVLESRYFVIPLFSPISLMIVQQCIIQSLCIWIFSIVSFAIYF
jgi:hypothetical protein